MSVCALFVLCGAATVLAEPAIPSLTGTWTVKSEGGVIIRGDKAGDKRHWEEKQTTLTAEVDVLNQHGRTLSGMFKSEKAQERFIAVIGHDNGSLYFADEDGVLEGKIIDPDTIEMVYRHVTANDSVAAVGIWQRKK